MNGYAAANIRMKAVLQSAALNTPTTSAHAQSRPHLRVYLHQDQEGRVSAAVSAIVGNRLGFDLLPQLASTVVSLRSEPDTTNVPVLRTPSSSGPNRQADSSSSSREYLDFPNRSTAASSPPLIRIRLTVPYRVHSRQMLCIGGSQIPFGWSFLSIAKVPMSWNPEDIWVAEVGSVLSLACTCAPMHSHSQK